MKKALFVLSALLMLSSCHTNPFLSEWDTPYGIPPYDKIKVSDYLPAIKEGIRQQQQEIDAITSNPQAPTFENTIVPLEFSGMLLRKVEGVLFNVSETDRSDALDAVVEEALPLLSAHGDNLAFHKAPLEYLNIPSLITQYESFMYVFMPHHLIREFDAHQKQPLALERHRSTLVEHAAITEALKSHDVDRIKKAIRTHLDSSLKALYVRMEN